VSCADLPSAPMIMQTGARLPLPLSGNAKLTEKSLRGRRCQCARVIESLAISQIKSGSVRDSRSQDETGLGRVQLTLTSPSQVSLWSAPKFVGFQHLRIDRR
jgi:hypothetical protein